MLGKEGKRVRAVIVKNVCKIALVGFHICVLMNVCVCALKCVCVWVVGDAVVQP